MMIISVIVLFATALVTISSCSQKNERPSREAVSNNGWEVSFFPALEERTREVGLPNWNAMSQVPAIANYASGTTPIQT
jgi:hypothetical protein